VLYFFISTEACDISWPHYIRHVRLCARVQWELLTTEEIGVDVVFSVRWRYDLDVRIYVVGQTVPSILDAEWVAKACPVVPVLIHPVPLSSHEVRVVDVVR